MTHFLFILILPFHVPLLCFGGNLPLFIHFIGLSSPATAGVPPLSLDCLLWSPQHGRALIWCIIMCWINQALSVWVVAAASLGPRAARTFQRTRTMTVYGRLTLTGWDRFPVRAAAPTSPTRTKLPHLYYLTSFTLVYLFNLFWCLFIILFIIFLSFLLPVLNLTLSSLCTYPNWSLLPWHLFCLLFWCPLMW